MLINKCSSSYFNLSQATSGLNAIEAGDRELWEKLATCSKKADRGKHAQQWLGRVITLLNKARATGDVERISQFKQLFDIIVKDCPQLEKLTYLDTIDFSYITFDDFSKLNPWLVKMPSARKYVNDIAYICRAELDYLSGSTKKAAEEKFSNYKNADKKRWEEWDP